MPALMNHRSFEAPVPLSAPPVYLTGGGVIHSSLITYSYIFPLSASAVRGALFHSNPIFMKTERQKISYLAPECEPVELKLEQGILGLSDLTDYPDGGEL